LTIYRDKAGIKMFKKSLKKNLFFNINLDFKLRNRFILTKFEVVLLFTDISTTLFIFSNFPNSI